MLLTNQRRARPYVLLCAAVIITLLSGRTLPGRTIDFQEDIQPILSKHCLSCHGGVQQKGGLNLITKDYAMTPTKSEAIALVPGHPDMSEMVYRVSTDDDDERMPPEGPPLTKDQAALIRDWIKGGAEWPMHWAYRPIVAPEPPSVKNAAWVQAPIDHFILAKLETEDVAPSEATDPTTLIRRVYLDLIGLPPPVKAVDAFIANPTRDALTVIVDDLLASEHFGERWGRHWLDQARYADSDGYEKDNARMDAWLWRDWVIDAINDDMPFDEFTRLQMAGDLVPDATPKTRLATAFHLQTLFNREGGIDPEEDRVKRNIDRLTTVGTTWLGLTLACSQCHDHPYDALTQREFYEFYDFFNNSDDATEKVTPPTNAKQRAALERLLAAEIEKAASSFAPWLVEQRKVLHDVHEKDRFALHDIDIQSATALNKTLLTRQDDGAFLASGEFAKPQRYTLDLAPNIAGMTGLRLHVLTDDSLPHKGPGRAENGNFVLSEVIVTSGIADETPTNDVALKRATADFSQESWHAREVLSNADASGWAVQPQTGKPHWLHIEFSQALTLTSNDTLRIQLDQNFGTGHEIGRFRLQAATGDFAMRRRFPERIAALLQKNADSLSEDEINELKAHHIQKKYRQIARTEDKLKNVGDANAIDVRLLKQRDEEIRDTYIFNRGDFLQPDKDGGAVFAGTHVILPALNVSDPDGRANRLDLANWMVSDENPLTARVTVNTIWHHLFGAGLVKSADDFGIRSDTPSHPELLDWLAHQFMELGWSRKQFIRQIVLSATYQQSSRARPDLSVSDPENRWLARQNRMRVEAEIVRDTTLAVAGLLSSTVGGPSVFTPLPQDLIDTGYANTFKWKTSDGEDRFRRGMYTFFKRSVPHPNLTSFDCPDSTTTVARRNRSNTPIQALTTLQNEVFHDAVQAFSAKILSGNSDSDHERLTQAFRDCVARPPNGSELATFDSLLKKSRIWYTNNIDDAKALVGDRKTDGADVSEMAAWVATLRVMTNMDEFLTRE
jgi:hypothetical protein